jgi:hypothetical protein
MRLLLMARFVFSCCTAAEAAARSACALEASSDLVIELQAAAE